MEGKTRHETELARDDDGATAAILQQLAGAVAAMTNTPGIRFSRWHRIEFQHSASSMAEVDALAAEIGAAPGTWNDERTHYTAVKEYGPNVSYLVVYITREHMAAYQEHWKDFPRDTGAASRDDQMAEAAA